jgi:hypothetical protein
MYQSTNAMKALANYAWANGGGNGLQFGEELTGVSKPELTARRSHHRLNDWAGAIKKLPEITCKDATVRSCDNLWRRYLPSNIKKSDRTSTA